jgi:Flp pilus assembly protein TadG
MFCLRRARNSSVAAAARAFLVGARGASGSAAVELALFAPILVAMSLYIIDLGMLAFRKMEVQYAAQAGAQYAIGQTNYNQSAIQSAVTNATTFTSVIASPAPSKFCGCIDPSNWSAGVNFCAASCDQCDQGKGPGVSTGTCTMGSYVTANATTTAPYTPLAPFGVATGTYNLTAASTVRIR